MRRLFTLQRDVVSLFSQMIMLMLSLSFSPGVQAAFVANLEIYVAQTPDANRDVVLEINEYMDALVKAGKFNGSLLIARDGKVIVSKGYGMSNCELTIGSVAA